MKRILQIFFQQFPNVLALSEIISNTTMADADVNEDLLDYEEEETTEQVRYNLNQLVWNRYMTKFSCRPLRRTELRPRKRAQSRETTSLFTAAVSEIFC